MSATKKPPLTSWLSDKTATLVVGLGTMVGATSLSAQSVIASNGLAGSVAVAGTRVAALGLPGVVVGRTPSHITNVTFGHGFSGFALDPDSGACDHTFSIGGTISGDSIYAGTSLGISHDFTLARNAHVTGAAI